MAAQDAVELRAEPFDGAPALMVEEVRAEFDGDALQRFECVAEQQQLALRVHVAALHALAIPGRADFDALFCASTFMKVVMPTGLPDALSITVNGSIEPSLCSFSRRSISAAIQSGCGTFVYHNFHSSPSATASRRSS